MRLMLSLVLEMIMTIDVMLLEVLFFPVVPVVQYTGFRYLGLKYHQFLVKLEHLLSLSLCYGVVFLGDCYFDYCLMMQFLRAICYAPEPGPWGGRLMNGGFKIMSCVNSCPGRCVCAPRFDIQISL